MTVINYTYEIINVDEQTRTMEVVYESPEHGVHHVSARLPYEGEALESVIEMFSPVYDWLEKSKPVASVQTGLKGSKTFDNTTPPLDEDPYQTLLDSLPLNRVESVKTLEELPLSNLRVERVYNSLNNLVGVEIFGPRTEVSTQDGVAMFNSATTVIEKAKTIGVTVLAVSNNANIKDFLLNIHGMSSTEMQGGYSIFNTPITQITGKKFIYSSSSYIDLFTQEEKFLIASEAMTDPEVKLFYDTLLSVDHVDKTNPVLIHGLNTMAEKSLLTTDRVNTLTTPG